MVMPRFVGLRLVLPRITVAIAIAAMDWYIRRWNLCHGYSCDRLEHYHNVDYIRHDDDGYDQDDWRG